MNSHTLPCRWAKEQDLQPIEPTVQLFLDSCSTCEQVVGCQKSKNALCHRRCVWRVDCEMEALGGGLQNLSITVAHDSLWYRGTEGIQNSREGILLYRLALATRKYFAKDLESSQSQLKNAPEVSAKISTSLGETDLGDLKYPLVGAFPPRILTAFHLQLMYGHRTKYSERVLANQASGQCLGPCTIGPGHPDLGATWGRGELVRPKFSARAS